MNAVLCVSLTHSWASSIRASDSKKLGKKRKYINKKAGSVLGSPWSLLCKEKYCTCWWT